MIAINMIFFSFYRLMYLSIYVSMYISRYYIGTLQKVIIFNTLKIYVI